MNKKSIALTLILSMMLTLLPASVFATAEEGSSEAESTVAQQTESADAPAAAGSVVVLYEEGEFDLAADETATADGGELRAAEADSDESAADAQAEQRDEELTEAARQTQEEILDGALSGDYTIDDTIVIEPAEDAEADTLVLGVVSSDGYSAEELADTLQASEAVKYAEPNYEYKISSVPAWNDTYINDEWQLGDEGINADLAPEADESSDAAVVAVIDTGIDYDHPDLKDRMWTAPETGYSLKGEHGVDFVYNTDDPMDENGHGTHCAGIIAAAADNSEGIAGVAGKSSKVQLMAVRVLDENGSGYLDSIVKGFKYVIRAKKEGVNVRAINCSLGANTTSDIFDEVIEQAGKSGILTVVAAGNETSNNDSTNVSPANSKSDYVVTVAATEKDGSLASFSNYGKKNVDIAAPGTDILSSVSYNNYAPYLYSADTIKSNTQFYGEFGDAVISTETDPATGEEVQSVTPVTGTDYSGSAITGVETFGASKMLSELIEGSTGKATLELASDSFCIGSNDTSLRWKISGATAGDKYVLYFPYEKRKGTPYLNITFRTHAEGEGGGILGIGDVRIDDVDADGAVTWTATYEESGFATYVSELNNSGWSASGYNGEEILLDRTDVKDTAADDYGFGFVFEAWDDGDVYIDISSVAISKADADEDTFGCYDIYSGTSMATPVVAGAAGAIAAANPDMDAEELKAAVLSTSKAENGLSDLVSTGSKLDFAEYSAQAVTAKPSVSLATADFAKGTVTLKGRGFGSSPQLKAYRNDVDSEGNVTWKQVDIGTSDIKVSDGKTITISKAGYSGYGLIGSEVKFEISNGEKTGEAAYYLVKGLKPYNDEYQTKYEMTDEYWYWSDKKDGTVSTDSDDDTEEEYTEEDVVEEDPVMPTGLSFVQGANELYKYNSSGDIYLLTKNETSGKYGAEICGNTMAEALEEYAETVSADVDYWVSDSTDDSEGYNYSLIANPAYLGDVIYELIKVDMVDRDAYVLMGMELNEEDYSWKVYYDSLAKFGSADSKLDFRKIDNATLAGYNGKLWLLGGNMDEQYDEDAPEGEEYTCTIDKSFFSCEPDPAGTKWNYSGQMPKGITNGRALAQGGKLYYFLSNDEEGTLDYTVYAYDGKTWSAAGELPKVLFADNKIAITITDMWIIIKESGDTALCATGIDKDGIIFAGKSFDGPGDTFRFNTKTGKIEPLNYTLWGTVSDREVDGTAAGSKLFTEYEKSSTEEAIGKSIPVSTGYVTLEKTVTGDGTGTVTGGGSYSKGDKTKITIKPDKGSYVYSVASSGLSPALNKEYGGATKESSGTITSSYSATADGSLEVYFGKLSTKVIMPKTSLSKRVGTRTVDAYTDGTVSDVKWTSSNKKYAKVNSDGTITFKKAGVGKTVTLTATAAENSKLKATCKVKILSREKTKFKWGGKKLTTKTKVLIDKPLAKSKKVKTFKAKQQKSGKVKLTWKKAKSVSGYIVLRKTGNGRYTQIAKLSAKKKAYVDKTAKKGKTYSYIVVGYKKVKGSSSIRISPASKVRKVKVKKK